MELFFSVIIISAHTNTNVETVVAFWWVMVSSRKQAHTAAAAHCQVLNGAPWSDPSARRSGIRRRMPDRGCRKGAVKCHQNWDTSMQPLLVESWVGEHWCADACLHKPTRSNLARGFCRVVTQRSDLTILHSSKRICELYSSGFKRWPWSPFPPRWRLFFILVGGGCFGRDEFYFDRWGVMGRWGLSYILP